MSKKVDNLYGSAIALAKAFDQNFVDLAAALRQLHEVSPERYSDFVKFSRVGTRKAYYLVSIDRTFREELNLDRDLLTELGWTKLVALQSYITKDNYKECIAFARNHTVAELKTYLAGGDVAENSHPVLLYFSPADYERLVNALIKHGAIKSGRALKDKEKALMRIISSAQIKKEWQKK